MLLVRAACEDGPDQDHAGPGSITMTSHSSFPLAGSGRSRRRLLVIQAAAEAEEKRARKLARAAQRAADSDREEQAVEDLAGVQTEEAVGRAVPELIGGVPSTEVDPDGSANDTVDGDSDTPLLRAFDPGDDEPDEKDVLETIGELMSGPRPATWVFCGDGPVETTFPDRFATELRTTYRRPLDVVVNTLVPGSPIKMVLEHLEWQLGRFHPDVVNLVIGSTTASTGPGFAATLTTLVDRLQKLGAAVVIHAPDPDGSDELQVQVDEIRELAGRRAIPLVDHAGADGDQERVDRLCKALKLQRPGS